MHSFDVTEVRGLLRGDQAIPAAAVPRPLAFSAPPARAPMLLLTSAIPTHSAQTGLKKGPSPRLLMAFGMTACLLAGLICQTGLPYLYLPHPESQTAATDAATNAAPATASDAAPAASVSDSVALDSDADPADTASTPPAITASDMHLVPAFKPGVDFGPVLGQLSIPAALEHPGEGGPYLTIAAMHPAAPAAAAAHHQAKLPSVARHPTFAPPLTDYHLESRFGPRRDPFNGELAFHAGLDLVAPFRSPVYDAAPGVVIFAGLKGAYGNCIDIDHGSGLVTRYGHLDKILVSRGQHVGMHQKIALLGDTGRSTGPHLHFEVRVNNEPQDPLKFLNTWHAPAVIPVKAAATDSD